MDGVKQEFYVPHLYGTGLLKSNPGIDQFNGIYNMHVRLFREMLGNRFVWEEVPEDEGINVRYNELTLANKGLIVFFRNATNGKLMALNAKPNGLNFYGDPTSYTVYGPGFKPVELSIKKCVPMYANKLRMPELDVVSFYSELLTQIDISVRINVKNARRTRMATVDENQRLSMSNIIQQIDEGKPVIEVSSQFNSDAIKALDFGVDPKSVAELHILRTRIYNEAVGYLGINGANQDKKERLVEAEVGANDEQVQIMQAVYLNERVTAIEQVNKMFGTNMKISFFSKEETVDNDVATEDDEGSLSSDLGGE